MKLIDYLNRKKRGTDYVRTVYVAWYWILVGVVLLGATKSFLNGWINADNYVVILIALIGWVVGVSYIKSQIRQSRELKATDEILSTLQPITEAIIRVYVNSNGTIAYVPRPTPNNFWFNKASERYDTMNGVYMQVLEATGKFHVVIENYEIALTPLWQYYRYILLKFSELANNLNDANSAFLSATNKIGLSQQDYNDANMFYANLQNEYIEMVPLLIDLRKILLNKFQGSIFNRELTDRMPYDTRAKTLKELATKKKVKEMARKSEEQLLSV